MFLFNIGLYTAYQLLDMNNEWNERPFEEYYTTIPKQKIQFPSVTICPSGEFNYLFYNIIVLTLLCIANFLYDAGGHFNILSYSII